MRTVSVALQALLDARNQEWVRADLYTFYNAADSVLGRWTNADKDLTVGGNTYLSTGPVFTRTSCRFAVGVEVEELRVDIAALSTDLLNGTAWLQALREGALDGGSVLLSRFLSDSWDNTAVGSVDWFYGKVATIPHVGRFSATVLVKSPLNLLIINMPRELYRHKCLHTLFDADCKLVKASFASASSVTAGSTLSVINCGLAQAAGYFDLGSITFTSGVNSGLTRTVRSYTPGALTLLTPLLQACTNGDTFNAYPGCDRTKATCESSKFNNVVNFKATPFVPEPETSL